MTKPTLYHAIYKSIGTTTDEIEEKITRKMTSFRYLVSDCALSWIIHDTRYTSIREIKKTKLSMNDS